MNSRSHRLERHIRPLHPPFTHFPLAAYVFTAGFDIASAAGGRHGWAAQLWHAGTFVLIAGLAICLITMATGFWDLIRFWPPEPGAPGGPAEDPMRTVAAHVSVMAAAFMLAAADVAWRLSDYGSRASTPPGVVAISLAAAITACAGGFFGGRLVFGHAMGVTPVALAANAGLPAGAAKDDHEDASAERAAPTPARPWPAGPDVRGREASDGPSGITGRPAGPYQEAEWGGRGAARGDTAP